MALQVNMVSEVAGMRTARKADGSVVIAHWAGNSYESWLIAKPGGKLVQATENDGWAHMRHGPCRQERELTVAEAKRLWPRYAGDIDAALLLVRPKEPEPKIATVAEIAGEIRLRGYVGSKLVFETVLTGRKAGILAHDLLGAALRSAGHV
jgi:hypothetical protein